MNVRESGIGIAEIYYVNKGSQIENLDLWTRSKRKSRELPHLAYGTIPEPDISGGIRLALVKGIQEVIHCSVKSLKHNCSYVIWEFLFSSKRMPFFH